MDLIGTVYTSTDVKRLHLIDESDHAEQRQRYFRKVMNEIAQEPLGQFVFTNVEEDIGGTFGKTWATVPTIRLPYTSAECTKDSIKFKDDNAFAVFVHESSHFQHMMTDHGTYIAPSLKHLKAASYTLENGFRNNKIIDLEYEAGYRAIRNGIIYKLFPEGDRTLLEANLVNMANYVTILNEDSIRQPGMTDEEYKTHKLALFKAWEKRVEYFSDISDYKITL